MIIVGREMLLIAKATFFYPTLKWVIIMHFFQKEH